MLFTFRGECVFSRVELKSVSNDAVMATASSSNWPTARPRCGFAEAVSIKVAATVDKKTADELFS